MKYLLLLTALAAPLLHAQVGYLEGPTPFQFPEILDGVIAATTTRLVYAVYRNPDGSKTLIIDVETCRSYSGLIDEENCDQPVVKSPALANYIKNSKDSFDKNYAEDVRRYEIKGVPAAASGNPQLIVLNGTGNNSVFLRDLKTFAASNTVLLPDGMSQTFGVRPVSTGVAREVWTHHSTITGTGGQMLVTDLASGRNAATISINTPRNFSADQILFSNSGKTAYVVCREQDADATGDFAALRIFDADARTLKSTARLPLVQVDFAMMAPDGLTIYLIGKGSLGREQITYYDVLSGTAELSVFAQEPLAGAVGLFNPLFPLDKPQLHPDGNRLFILHNFQVRAASIDSAYAVSVFDLAQRKVASKFPLTFANGGKGRKMELSQDGTQLTILSDKGEVQFMDPISGLVFGGFQGPDTTVDIFTTPLIP
jgi:hypothetical protein